MSQATAEDENRALEDNQIDVKLKLAALWTSFMFLYVYVDIFGFFTPGTIEDILAGKVFTFQITPTFVMIALVSVTIPALMVALSLILPARVNRWTNIVVGILFIPFSIFNVVGESWIHYYFGAGVEVLLLALVLWYAWKWPTTPVDAIHTTETKDQKTGQPQDL